jgi:predicted nuclease of restriction endonuclease-like (RecB) superfamily
MNRKRNNKLIATDAYAEFLRSIKKRIQTHRFLAYRAVNRQQSSLYLGIGQEIVERQKRYGWGKSVVERLAKDLRRDVPNQDGFSAPNLWFMRQLYLEYKGHPNLLQLVREIPWGQNIAIMTKIKDPKGRAYYLKATAELGWSRSVLLHQIEADAYERRGLAKKQHNFRRALPHHLISQSCSEAELRWLEIWRKSKDENAAWDVVQDMFDRATSPEKKFSAAQLLMESKAGDSYRKWIEQDLKAGHHKFSANCLEKPDIEPASRPPK